MKLVYISKKDLMRGYPLEKVGVEENSFLPKTDDPEELKKFIEKEEAEGRSEDVSYFSYKSKAYFVMKKDGDPVGYLEIDKENINETQKRKALNMIESIKESIMSLRDIEELGTKETDEKQKDFLILSKDLGELRRKAKSIHESSKSSVFVYFNELDANTRRSSGSLRLLKNTTVFVPEIMNLFPLEIHAINELLRKKSSSTQIILGSYQDLQGLETQVNVKPLLKYVTVVGKYLYVIH